MGLVVDISKARVTYPDGEVEPVRFLFRGNRAAVWSIDRDAGTATRLLLVEGVTFTKRTSAKNPHTLTLEGGTEWYIRPLTGGGCGCTKGVTRGMSWEKLLDPDVSQVP